MYQAVCSVPQWRLPRGDLLGGGGRQPEHERRAEAQRQTSANGLWKQSLPGTLGSLGKVSEKPEGTSECRRGLNSSNSGGLLGADKWAVHRQGEHTHLPSRLGPGAGGLGEGGQGCPLQFVGKGGPKSLLSPRKSTWVIPCLPAMLQAPHRHHTQRVGWACGLPLGLRRFWHPQVHPLS